MYVVFVTFCLKENTKVLNIFLSNSVESGEISSHVVLYEGGGQEEGEEMYLTHLPTHPHTHTPTHTHTHTLSSVLAACRGAWQL